VSFINWRCGVGLIVCRFVFFTKELSFGVGVILVFGVAAGGDLNRVGVVRCAVVAVVAGFGVIEHHFFVIGVDGDFHFFVGDRRFFFGVSAVVGECHVLIIGVGCWDGDLGLVSIW